LGAKAGVVVVGGGEFGFQTIDLVGQGAVCSRLALNVEAKFVGFLFVAIPEEPAEPKPQQESAKQHDDDFEGVLGESARSGAEIDLLFEHNCFCVFGLK
jgi:hypothetical protein